MPFEVRADQALRIVVVIVAGRFEASEVAPMVCAARELAAPRGWNILYDMREAIPGDLGAGELFWLPRRLPALAGATAARTRIATLHPPAFASLATYWEDTFRNAGLQARAFVEEAAAHAWLGVDAPREAG